MLRADLSSGHAHYYGKEVKPMNKQRLQVLAEGSCPFLGGVDAVCCYSSVIALR